ncbi:MAG: NAD(P)-dependent oxidoreductase [Actinobacteria bacterium]|nr:NAD(P)-dependent oxidoreductase [Actinomycetota bacterium]
MLVDEKILVTGPAGQIAEPLARYLAKDNEVWGIARFGDESARARVDGYGITTRSVDLTSGGFGELPDDFTYVLHLAADQSGDLDYDRALRVNAEGTGLLLQHCRAAKGALVMSTFSVYRPNPDPDHRYTETDPLGEVNAVHAPTYSVSKIGQEAVARFCARAFGLPITIARMNASYGDNGGLPAIHLAMARAGQPVVTRWDPCTYSPIHEDDICAQVGKLLQAASVPATVVNWAGDEPVSVQQWCAEFAALLGRAVDVEVRELPGTQPSAISDNTKRLSITGPCTVPWREGMRRMFAARP